MGAPWSLLVGYALEAGSAGLALRVAREKPYHRPFAVFAAYYALVDPLRAVVQLARDPAQHHPFAGAQRVLYHTSAALYMSLALALALAATHLCAPRLSGHARGVALAAVVLPIATYPHAVGKLPIVAVQALASAMTWGVLIVGYVDDEWPTPTHFLVMLAAATQTALLAGPLVDVGTFATNWAKAEPLLFGAQIATLAIQAAWLRDLRRR